jgi:hypothetical protein
MQINKNADAKIPKSWRNLPIGVRRVDYTK